ncbi:hypothetical protein PMAYCL1PPCAC_14418 [Pristionchus mayeri]|uniref:Uncharacterized protein n=1 Tax=Pristionchus mayeri TaxID=1317129 RepID=A0AAN5CAI9_9BILA|nr:hypothetical protein PMAYCL1PPCAC_14418 [Pristionchus mayeri]
MLSDSSPDDVLRFLLESFASFGPPEAYVVGNETKNWEYVQQTITDVESNYKVSIKCVGFAKEHECGKAISREGVRKAGGEAGFRWIDTLHNSVVEWNQRSNKIFNYTLSPFEVMFGREEWRGCSSARRVPPWVEEKEEREGERREEEQKLPPLSVRIPNAIRRLSAPDATFLDGKLLDPGTGMRFEIGDRVYVRNMHYVDTSESSGGTSAKKREECRYYRGVVAQEDETHPEFLYRVAYDPDLVDQDTLPYEAWPTLLHDTNNELDSSWFSPWDLAPSSFDLQCRRTTNPPKEVSASRCSCELEYCDLLVDEECARGMIVICCTRRREGPCTAHQTMKRRCGRKKKEEETEKIRVPKSEAEGGGDARYIFKDGSLVRISRVAKGHAEMPEDILQQ